MGGPVFAHADGIVGEHKGHGQATDGRHAQGRAFVVREHEEGGGEGVHASVVGEAVGDGAHGVFAHAEVNVAAQPGLAVEITLAGEGGQRRTRQIRIAAD